MTETSSSSSRGREVESPPEDGISRLRFSPYSNNLLVSAWDSTVRLYDADANVQMSKFSHPTQPLDCCFIDDFSALSGGSDGTLRRYNFSTVTEEILGKHDASVNCVEYSSCTGQIMTGSCDKTLRLWDTRANGSSQEKHIQSDEVECMSLAGYCLVVISGTVTVNVYDLRNMSRSMHTRESSLRYKTNCVCCYRDEAGYAIGSIEGRIALEFFDLSETAEAKKYAFRCHPKSKNGRYYLVPVNAIEFHPSDGRFVTGDNEGYCSIWDRDKKKRLFEFPQYPTGIASLSYNRDGQLLAVGVSYTYQDSEKKNDTTHVFIENVAETDHFY